VARATTARTKVSQPLGVNSVPLIIHNIPPLPHPYLPTISWSVLASTSRSANKPFSTFDFSSPNKVINSSATKCDCLVKALLRLNSKTTAFLLWGKTSV